MLSSFLVAAATGIPWEGGWSDIDVTVAVSSTFGHGYVVSNACFLPPLVPVMYYPASVVYHPVSIARLFQIYFKYI